ncbi:TIGR04104 family putative zinc finger protein [Guptibacillus algicola]|uniref:TIGR04104 family putative zinc finger protein n=1 Tax=Guptibacillus algicola TaxID=225844 RepID=UPI001CD72F11|nr:hypothetical protein [Alkalihalobacillus algicola]
MNFCPNCHAKVSRWELVKKTLIKKIYPIRCTQCSQSLYFTAKSLRITFSLIPILPIVLIMLIVFDVPETISGLTIFALLFMLLSTYPFLLELTDKEKKLY